MPYCRGQDRQVRTCAHWNVIDGIGSSPSRGGASPVLLGVALPGSPIVLAATADFGANGRSADADGVAQTPWEQLDLIAQQASQQLHDLMVDLLRAGAQRPELAAGLALALSALALALLASRRRIRVPSLRSERHIATRADRGNVEAVPHTAAPPDLLRIEQRDLLGETANALLLAYTAIEKLKEAGPLQLSLFRELEALIRRLGFSPGAPSAAAATEASHDREQLGQILRDLRRLIAIAEAAAASMLSTSVAADAPRTRQEACAFLGVNANAGDDDIKKAVNGLRRCWHPDYALDEEDLRLREQRMRLINCAWDVIRDGRPDAHLDDTCRKAG